jgi:hypothetical protein
MEWSHTVATKSLEQLQQDYADITEKNRLAYDALNSSPAGTGFGNDDAVAVQYKNAVRSGNKAKIAKLKPQFDKLSAAYKKTQETKNALKKELATAKKQAETDKNKGSQLKSAKAVADKAIGDLKIAEASIDAYGGNDKYIAAYQAAQLANDALVTAGGKPTVLPEQKIVVPPLKGAGDTGTGGTDGETKPKLELLGDILTPLADPSKVAELKFLQENLKKNFGSFYKGAVDGLSSWAETQAAVTTILDKRNQLPVSLQKLDFTAFITDPNSGDILGAKPGGIGGTGAGGKSPTSFESLSDPTTAAGIINGVVKSLLSRDATSKEVVDLTKILNDAERKTPRKYDSKTGKSVSGLDQVQFVTDLIKTGKYADKTLGKLKTIGKLATELAAKKTDVRTLNGQSLMQTAKDNGITLGQDQLDAYTNQIQNGKDINIIKNQIRSTAGLGMPDHVKKLLADGTDLSTIYAPYKSLMYQILEVNPDKIDLNDPTLRMAIGPDKEMSIYDFQNTLRKDARWQYTNNAKESVSSSVQQVLKDFGFVG